MLRAVQLTTLLSVMRELSKPGRDVPVLHKQLLPVVLAGLASPRGLSHVTDVVQLDKLAHTFSVLSLWHTVAKDSGTPPTRPHSAPVHVTAHTCSCRACDAVGAHR